MYVSISEVYLYLKNILKNLKILLKHLIIWNYLRYTKLHIEFLTIIFDIDVLLLNEDLSKTFFQVQTIICFFFFILIHSFKYV